MSVCTYYSRIRPLGIGCYPSERGNEPIAIESFPEPTAVLDGSQTAWGRIEYPRPLTAGQKEHYSFFEEADVAGSRRVEQRAAKIARAVSRRTGRDEHDVVDELIAFLFDSDEARAMSDRELVAALV